MGRNSFDALWTAEDVARRLRIPVGTVRNRASAGEIPSVKIGRHRRYEPAEIERWIAEQRELPKQAA